MIFTLAIPLRYLSLTLAIPLRKLSLYASYPFTLAIPYASYSFTLAITLTGLKFLKKEETVKQFISGGEQEERKRILSPRNICKFFIFYLLKGL